MYSVPERKVFLLVETTFLSTNFYSILGSLDDVPVHLIVKCERSNLSGRSFIIPEERP